VDLLVSAIVGAAFRLTGQMSAPGRGLSPEELAEGTQFLNVMLDSWNIMRNSVYTVQDLVFALTPNQMTYPIGLNAAAPFNVPRPNFITNASIVYYPEGNYVRIPLDILSVDQWARIRISAVIPDGPQTFGLPTKLYYDKGYSQTSPTGTASLNLWLPPDGNGPYQLELFVAMNLPTALGSGSTLYVPDGYVKAIEWNLAVDLLACYPLLRPLPPGQEARLVRGAADAKKYVNNLNSPTLRMRVDPALSPAGGSGTDSTFNWLSDNTVT
jgi:hypothetical protein